MTESPSFDQPPDTDGFHQSGFEDIGDIQIFEYSTVDERISVVDNSDIGILRDDSIPEIGSKLSTASGTRVCWWTRAEVDGAFVRDAVRTNGDGIVTSMFPEVPTERAHKRTRRSGTTTADLMTRGGIAHICPYSPGVYNIVKQSQDGQLPPTDKSTDRTVNDALPVASLNHPRPLDSANATREVHFVKETSLSNITDAVPFAPTETHADKITLVQTPMNWPRPSHRKAVRITELVLKSKFDCPSGIEACFSSDGLSGSTVAAGVGRRDKTVDIRVKSNGLADVPDAQSLVETLANALARPAPTPTTYGALVMPSHIATARLPDEFEVRAGGGSTAIECWESTIRAMSDRGIHIPSSPVERRFKIEVAPVVPRVPSRKALLRVLQSSPYKQFVYANAIGSDDNAIACAYRRTGVGRQVPDLGRAYERVRRGTWGVAKLLEHAKSLGVPEDVLRDLRLLSSKSRRDPDLTIRIEVTSNLLLVVRGSNETHACRAITAVVAAIIEACDDAPANRSLDDILADDGLGHTETADVKMTVGAPPNLTDLTETNKPLFNTGTNTTYARMCGSVDQRQPISVTHDELRKMGEHAPASATPKTTGDGNTAYICPEVWCEQDRLAMTREQAKDRNWTCPNGSPSIDLMSSKYWKGATSRNIGFLSSTKHSRGHCMPCCFRRISSGRRQECSSDAIVNESIPTALDEADEDSQQASGYMLAVTNSPLPIGRRGRVDASLGKEAYRVGVNQQEHRLVSCVAAATGQTVSDIIESLVSIADPGTIATMSDGAVFKFIATNAPFRPELERSRRDYYDYAQSDKGRKRLSSVGVDVPINMHSVDPGDAFTLREMIIGHVFREVCAKIRSGDPRMDTIVAIAMGAVQGIFLPCLVHQPESSKGHKVKFTLSCPGPGGKPRVPCVLYERDGVLEPVVNIDAGLRERIDRTVDKSARSCKLSGRNAALLKALDRLGFPARRSVLNDANIVVGFTVDGDLIIPAIDEDIIRGTMPVVYRSRHLAADKKWTSKRVRKLFDDLAAMCDSDMFRGASYSSGHVQVGAMTIPMKHGRRSKAGLPDMSLGCLPLAISSSPETSSALRLRATRVASRALFTRDPSAYVAILHPMSPLNTSQKRALFCATLGSDHPGIDYREALAATGERIRADGDSSGDILFTENDIASGLMSDMLKRRANDAMSDLVPVEHVVTDAVPDPPRLDVAVSIPDAIREILGRRAVAHKTSFGGDAETLEALSRRVGGDFTAEDYVSSRIADAVHSVRLGMDPDPSWPKKLHSGLREWDFGVSVSEAATNASSPIVAFAKSLHARDADIEAALFAGNAPPAAVRYNASDGVDTRIGDRKSTPRVALWRDGDALCVSVLGSQS